MSPDKQLKGPTLNSLAAIERMKGRDPLMTTLMDFLERLLDGEESESAVRLIAEHGLPAMMLDLQEACLLEQSHWETWKSKMNPVEAEMILATRADWPHEVREWAEVVTVSGL